MHEDHKMHIDTKVIHAGQRPEEVTGAVMPPIFTTSTYAQSSPGVHKGFEYTRSHNPTRYALERMVARLEGSKIAEARDPSCGGFAFASGLAAMGTALELCDAGAHIVCMDDVYGGSNRLLSRVRARSQGLKVDYVDLTDLNKAERALKSETAMVWVETPTNPTLKLVDLTEIAKIARKKSPKALLVCDNTFASSVNQTPLAHGFDIVLHSTTKYMNGHSDAVGGVLVTGDEALCDRIRFVQNSIGSVMGPFDSYLVLRDQDARRADGAAQRERAADRTLARAARGGGAGGVPGVGVAPAARDLQEADAGRDGDDHVLHQGRAG